MMRTVFVLLIVVAAIAGCGSGVVTGNVTPETKRTEEASKASNATQGTPESVSANP
jgi:uncharacterized protein YceK